MGLTETIDGIEGTEEINKRRRDITVYTVYGGLGGLILSLLPSALVQLAEAAEKSIGRRERYDNSIAEANSLINGGGYKNYARAIDILANVPKNHPNYLNAHFAIADLIENKIKDYIDLVIVIDALAYYSQREKYSLWNSHLVHAHTRHLSMYLASIDFNEKEVDVEEILDKSKGIYDKITTNFDKSVEYIKEDSKRFEYQVRDRDSPDNPPITAKPLEFYRLLTNFYRSEAEIDILSLWGYVWDHYPSQGTEWLSNQKTHRKNAITALENYLSGFKMLTETEFHKLIYKDYIDHLRKVTKKGEVERTLGFLNKGVIPDLPK